MLIKYFFIVLLVVGLLLGGVGYAAIQSTTPKQRVVVMLGPPGAGKGTVAVKLSETLKLPHISTGDLFRENLKKETPLGKKAKGYMEKGELVPDALVLDMLLSRVKENDCSKGYILDGFPRTLVQAEALSKKIKESGKVIAVNLDVADDLLVDRIINRRVCTGCGAPFHVTNNPPKVAGVCDRCSGELVQRSDDTKEVVTKRLNVYHEQTAPVANFYQKQGVMVNVNGAQPLSDVFSDVLQRVGKD